MPAVKANESKEHYMERCVPYLIKEGKKQDQAVAQCSGMFRQHKKKGAMMKNKKPRGNRMQQLTVNVDCRKLRVEYLAGEKYLVAPAVLMTPGVHEGSRGALLYREKELDDYSPAWNHKPIVLNHPTKGIACTQEFLNQYSMGILLDTGFVRGKQRAEAWFNEKRVQTVSPKTYSKLKAKEQMELSTGLFVDQKGSPGKFNGKRYQAIATNHKPDHLAVLTDSEGACSIADGGGLFSLNAKRKSRIKKYVEELLRNNKRKDRRMKTKLTKKQFVAKLIKNERANFDEKDRKWLMNLDAKQLKKLMPKKLAHVFETDEELDEVLNEKLEDRIAELNRKRNKKKLLQNGNKQHKRERVDNNADPDDDDDDADGDDDDQTSPAKNRRREEKPEKNGNKKRSLKDFLENQVPDELRPILNQALKAAASEEERLIKKIVANKSSKFKAEDLKKLAPKLGSLYLDHLRNLATMVENAGDDDDEGDTTSYFGAAVAPVNNSDTDDGEEGDELEVPMINNNRFSRDLKLGIPAGMLDDEDEEDEIEDED